jgi:hypothetical protein
VVQASLGKNVRNYSKNKESKKGWSVAEVIEQLLGKQKILRLNLSASREKNNDTYVYVLYIHLG